MARTKPISPPMKTEPSLTPVKNPSTDQHTSNGPERRRSRRIRDPILVILYRNRLGSKTARPLDISLEGIGIDTAGPLNVGENLQIALIIGESQVKAVGRVVYTEKETSGRFRSGIEFQEISERNRRIIRLYLEKMQRQRRSNQDEQTL